MSKSSFPPSSLRHESCVTVDEHLRDATSQAGWKGVGSREVPSARWGEIDLLLTMLQGEAKGLPKPHIGAGEDGAAHLHWRINHTARLDLELDEDGFSWTFQNGDGWSDGHGTIEDAKRELLRILSGR